MYPFSWRRKWQPTPVFLPGESHGQQGLACYTVHGVAIVKHDLVTKPPPPPSIPPKPTSHSGCHITLSRIP